MDFVKYRTFKNYDLDALHGALVQDATHHKVVSFIKHFIEHLQYQQFTRIENALISENEFQTVQAVNDSLEETVNFLKKLTEE